MTFLSSGASVSSSTASPILEEASVDPSNAASLGYGRSKWVAEQICGEAARRGRAAVNVVRVGQICGDTEKGIWSESEVSRLCHDSARPAHASAGQYWPLLVRSAGSTGCLPTFDDVSASSIPHVEGFR